MNTNTTRTKSLGWLILPFAIIGVLILTNWLLFNMGKSKDGSLSTSLGLLDNSSSLPTKFSPEILATLANKFDVNYIAGECINMGCKKISDDIVIDGSKFGNQYSYYSDDITNESNRLDEMHERLTTIDNLQALLYTIKNKSDYEEYCKYLKSHSFNNIKVENKKGNFPHYIYNNAVFIDRNYLIDLNGYCFEVYPLRTFNSDTGTNHSDSSSTFQ